MVNKLKNKETSLLVVDDHFIVLKGLEFFFKNYYNFFLYKATNYEEAIDTLKIINIDIVILDLNINGKVDFRIIKKIKTIQPKVSILVFSALEDEAYSLKSKISGANGFLSKISSDIEMKNAINHILKKGSYFKSEGQNETSLKVSKDDKATVLEYLSTRENAIANLLAKGIKNKEICSILNLKMTTVSTYKMRIYQKLKIDNIISLSKIMKKN